MRFNERSRHDKLIGSIYEHFRGIADNTGRDSAALHVCQHLMALKNDALEDQMFLALNEIWESQYPEENPIKVAELQWGLKILESDMRRQMRSAEVIRTCEHDPRARLKLINGGLSDSPKVPYERVGKDIVDF